MNCTKTKLCQPNHVMPYTDNLQLPSYTISCYLPILPAAASLYNQLPSSYTISCLLPIPLATFFLHHWLPSSYTIGCLLPIPLAAFFLYHQLFSPISPSIISCCILIPVLMHHHHMSWPKQMIYSSNLSQSEITSLKKLIVNVQKNTPK